MVLQTNLQYDASGIKVLSLNELYNEAPTKDLVLPHRRGFYHVLYVSRGRVTHHIDFEPHTLSAGEYLFINQDQVHSHTINPRADGYLISFTEDFWIRNDIDLFSVVDYTLFNGYNNRPIVKAPTNKREYFQELLGEMLWEYETAENDWMRGEVLRGLLRNFLIRAERLKRTQIAHQLGNKYYHEFVLFIKLVRAHYSKTRNAEDFASMMSISSKKLNYIVQASTAKTTKAYIDDAITLQAKRSLANSDRAIGEISTEIGFDEATNFIKYFKKHAGITPKRFRKQLTEDN